MEKKEFEEKFKVGKSKKSLDATIKLDNNAVIFADDYLLTEEDPEYVRLYISDYEAGGCNLSSIKEVS